MLWYVVAQQEITSIWVCFHGWITVLLWHSYPVMIFGGYIPVAEQLWCLHLKYYFTSTMLANCWRFIQVFTCKEIITPEPAAWRSHVVIGENAIFLCTTVSGVFRGGGDTGLCPPSQIAVKKCPVALIVLYCYNRHQNFSVDRKKVKDKQHWQPQHHQLVFDENYAVGLGALRFHATRYSLLLVTRIR